MALYTYLTNLIRYPTYITAFQNQLELTLSVFDSTRNNGSLYLSDKLNRNSCSISLCKVDKLQRKVSFPYLTVIMKRNLLSLNVSVSFTIGQAYTFFCAGKIRINYFSSLVSEFYGHNLTEKHKELIYHNQRYFKFLFFLSPKACLYPQAITNVECQRFAYKMSRKP